MDTLTQENEIVKNALTEAARFYAAPEWYETVPLFDDARGQYLLVDEGWRGWERIRRVWVHIERREEKWWIQQDLTYDGITPALVAAGIPKDRIVLAFQHPSRRALGEYAAV